MRNDKYRLIRKALQVIQYLFFRFTIQCTRRLVQDQNRIIRIQCPCNRNTLHLALRQTCPLFAQHRIQLVRKFIDKFCTSKMKNFFQCFLICLFFSKSNHFPDTSSHQKISLWDVGKQPAHLSNCPHSAILQPYDSFPGLRFINAHQNFKHC